jgi:protein-disulfide isomerase
MEENLRGRHWAVHGAMDQADGASDVQAAQPAVQLVVFGDYECGYCRNANLLVRQLLQRFGTIVRFRFRHFPLTRIHPYAKHAAEAAVSVRSQAGEEAFWAMHNAIFAHQQRGIVSLDDAQLARYAEAVGAEGARVLSDLDTGKFEETVEVDFVEGIRLGVYDTPTFFIDEKRFNGDWRNIEQLAAALAHAAASSMATAAL